MHENQPDITGMLVQATRGDQAVVDGLMPLVYDQLRDLAEKQLARERPDHTLGATALVHEAYFKLVDQKRVTWQNRAHFFAIAARAMRRILINYARSRMAEKRGGGQAVATLDEDFMGHSGRAEELVDLDDALSRLGAMNERQSKVVEYRFFGGLKDKEIAQVLGISIPSVRRDWRLARAWLSRELRSA
jgi:RNA polymerase sigma factor (TIGR02999 family)